MAVIQGHLRLEDALRRLAPESGDPQIGGAVDLARQALAAERITPQTYAAVEQLTALRSLATEHAVSGISVGSAQQYLALVDVVLGQLRKSRPLPLD